MREKLKYFIINKPCDFARGLCENMIPADGGLQFSSGRESGVAMFMSRIFDAGERGMDWHRLTVKTENCAGSDLRITVWAADTTELAADGKKRSILSVFEDASLSLQKKRELFEPFLKKRIAGGTDVLKHDVSGRYIWFLVEMYSRSDRPARLTELKAYLPSRSWIDYLPQLYRKNDGDSHFLERYLAIFQTLYEELDAQIADSASFFDPECAEYDFLLWLAEWLDLSDSWLWEEEKLRRFIMRAISLYRRRGTRESLEEIIELYTGERPYVIEEFSMSRFAGTEFYEKTLLPLYGDDPYTVTVLIKSTLIKNEHDFNALQRVAAEMLPASFTLHIVLLEPYIFAGKFSYLGVNSTLGSYKPAAFDGRSAMMLSTIQHSTDSPADPAADGTSESN